jgi:hypothetical protein
MEPPSAQADGVRAVSVILFERLRRRRHREDAQVTTLGKILDQLCFSGADVRDKRDRDA